MEQAMRFKMEYQGFTAIYNKTYFFIYNNWELCLYPSSGLNQDFECLMKHRQTERNEFVANEQIDGYTIERQKISFCGSLKSVNDVGILIYDIDYFLIGEDYIQNINVEQVYVYSKLFNMLFSSRKGVGVNQEHQIELHEFYKELDFGSFLKDRIRVVGSSSEYASLFDVVPFRYENFIGFKADNYFDLEKCKKLYFALKNSIKLILNQTNVGVFISRLIYTKNIENNKEKNYKGYITLVINDENDGHGVSAKKNHRYIQLLDNNFAKLIENVCNADLYILHVTDRKSDKQIDIPRMILLFAAIEFLSKKNQEEYKNKYENERFASKLKRFEFRSSINIIYNETKDILIINSPIEINAMVDKLVHLRHCVSHGDLNIKIEPIDIDYLNISEEMIYILSLKNCGYDIESIKKCYSIVFNKKTSEIL